MKIAVIFPPMLVGGRPLDFARLFDDPRGTTGSEIMTLAFAAELANLEHDVTLYIDQPCTNSQTLWIRPLTRNFGFARIEPLTQDSMRGHDAILVPLDVNILQYAPKNTLRVCLQQVNDFDYGEPGFDRWTDLYVSPSENHRQHMIERSKTPASKWAVVPNGCYADLYEPVEKTPGLCVYASSPDRGLHHVLTQWPRIKSETPHARLKIFYYGLDGYLAQWRAQAGRSDLHPFHQEHVRRAAIIERALPALKDVEVVGSTSRRQMAKELSTAELMLYPCDPICYTEGFSCSTLEGCASGAIPILIGADALSSIYRDAIPVIKPPASKNLDLWTSIAIAALNNQGLLKVWRPKARQFAEAHDWRILAKKLESVLLGALERKKSA